MAKNSKRPFLWIIGPIALSMLTFFTSCSAKEETFSKQQWLDAEPRSGAESSSGGDAKDRCDLYREAEVQLNVGMTKSEAVAAIGEPDQKKPAEDEGESWVWSLGFCSFIDYDNYVLYFIDDRLARFSFIQG